MVKRQLSTKPSNVRRRKAFKDRGCEEPMRDMADSPPPAPPVLTKHEIRSLCEEYFTLRKDIYGDGESYQRDTSNTARELMKTRMFYIKRLVGDFEVEAYEREVALVGLVNKARCEVSRCKEEVRDIYPKMRETGAKMIGYCLICTCLTVAMFVAVVIALSIQ